VIKHRLWGLLIHTDHVVPTYAEYAVEATPISSPIVLTPVHNDHSSYMNMTSVSGNSTDTIRRPALPLCAPCMPIPPRTGSQSALTAACSCSKRCVGPHYESVQRVLRRVRFKFPIETPLDIPLDSPPFPFPRAYPRSAIKGSRVEEEQLIPQAKESSGESLSLINETMGRSSDHNPPHSTDGLPNSSTSSPQVPSRQILAAPPQVTTVDRPFGRPNDDRSGHPIPRLASGRSKLREMPSPVPSPSRGSVVEKKAVPLLSDRDLSSLIKARDALVDNAAHRYNLLVMRERDSANELASETSVDDFDLIQGAVLYSPPVSLKATQPVVSQPERWLSWGSHQVASLGLWSGGDLWEEIDPQVMLEGPLHTRTATFVSIVDKLSERRRSFLTNCEGAFDSNGARSDTGEHLLSLRQTMDEELLARASPSVDRVPFSDVITSRGCGFWIGTTRLGGACV